MRKTAVFCLIVLFAAGLAACSSPRGSGPVPIGQRGNAPQETARVLTNAEAARLIERARAEEGRDGCAEAMPTYRVLAAYGRYFEVAQVELADCLLRGGDALDRAEAMVWLQRAARAGHETAQMRLAQTLMDAGEHEAALGWALVYNTENDRSVAPMRDLPPSFIAAAEAGLSAQQVESARDFAQGFTPSPMAAFQVPERLRRKPGPDDMGGLIEYHE